MMTLVALAFAPGTLAFTRATSASTKARTSAGNRSPVVLGVGVAPRGLPRTGFVLLGMPEA